MVPILPTPFALSNRQTYRNLLQIEEKNNAIDGDYPIFKENTVSVTCGNFYM